MQLQTHVVGRFGISALTHHQAFVGTVIRKDLCEIAIVINLVESTTKISSLPGIFLILNLDTEALELLLVVAK